MIQKFNGYQAKDMESVASMKLPVGAYVGRICQAQIESTQWGDKLVLLMDVAEGQYQGFYHKLFEANKNSQFESARKYKGVLRLNLPKDDGSDNDNVTKNIFGAFIFRIHQSNPGYNWEASWDERTLVGKSIGMIIREAEYGEYDMEGHPIVKGTYNEIGGTCTVDQVRQGEAPSLKKRVMKDRTNMGNGGFYPAPPAPAASGFQTTNEQDDMPF